MALGLGPVGGDTGEIIACERFARAVWHVRQMLQQHMDRRAAPQGKGRRSVARPQNRRKRVERRRFVRLDQGGSARGRKRARQPRFGLHRL